jgi:AbrB family looped-hinge helix DNA binding protein
MSATTLTKKGQVTIPKAIRDALGLRERDKVLFVRREHEVILKVVKGTVLDLRGSVKPRRKPEDFEFVRATVKKAVAKRAANR